jgi:hypothetical protein
MTQISSEVQSLFSVTGVSLGNSFKALQQLSDLRPLLPQLDSKEDAALISRLKDSDSRRSLEQFLDSLASLERDREDLHRSFTNLPSLDIHVEDELPKILLELRTLGLGESTKLSLSALAAHVRELHASLTNVVAIFKQATQHLGIDCPCTSCRSIHTAETD